MKKTLNVTGMIAIAIAVGVGIAYAVTWDTSGDPAVLGGSMVIQGDLTVDTGGGDRILLNSGNDEIAFGHGDDSINFYAGNDWINFRDGTGQIRFGADTPPQALISYDDTAEELEVSAKEDLILMSVDGDIVIQLGN